MAAGLGACRPREGAPKASIAPTVTPRATATPSASGPEIQKLVGQWMRTDDEYMIWVEGASPDGKLAARYLNPRPVNVSRAEWKREEGSLRVLVEMRDRNYPGSYYTLTYDPSADGFFGVYHHLGLGQTYQVAFYRFDADGKEGR